jgi:nitroreductase
MDVHHALLTRRTIHSFLPDAVEQAVLDRAVEAAHHAPSHRMVWPWRFTRLGPVAREAIAARAVTLKGKGGPLPAEEVAAIRQKFFDVPELWVVSQVVHEEPARLLEDYAAVACAIENLSLSLHADGIGSKWSTGAITTDGATYVAAGVDPAAERVVGFVWIGRAREIPQIKRPDWSAVVRTTA